jgi:hypothetical protein
MTDQQNWYEFTAYNAQAIYGFGTEQEADGYSDILNRGREINVYGYRPMTEAEAAPFNSGDRTDGFNLDEELKGQS